MRTPAAGASPRALPAAAPRALALRTEASALTGRRRLPPVPRARGGTGFIPDSTDVLFPDPIDMGDNGVFCGCLCGSPVHLSKKWERGRLQAAFCTLKEARPEEKGTPCPRGRAAVAASPRTGAPGLHRLAVPVPGAVGGRPGVTVPRGRPLIFRCCGPSQGPRPSASAPDPLQSQGWSIQMLETGRAQRAASHVVNHTKTPTSQTAGLCPRGFTEPLARDALVHQVKGMRGHSQALNATQSTGPNADFSRQTKSTKIKGFRHLEPRRTDGAPGTGTHGGAVSPRSGVGSPPWAPAGGAGCGFQRVNPCLRLPVCALGQTQRGEKGQAGS